MSGPLLTHCSNPRPLNLIGLDNSDRNSGVNLGIYNGAGKAQAEIWHVTLHKFAPKFNQATDWLHLNFNLVNI
jgi:hypothetical protein